MASLPAASDLLSELPAHLSTPSPAPPSLAIQKKLLKEQRKAEKDAKKEAKKAEVGVPVQLPEKQSAPLRFLPREWGKVQPLEGEEVGGERRKVSIMSWNVSRSSWLLLAVRVEELETWDGGGALGS